MGQDLNCWKHLPFHFWFPFLKWHRYYFIAPGQAAAEQSGLSPLLTWPKMETIPAGQGGAVGDAHPAYPLPISTFRCLPANHLLTGVPAPTNLEWPARHRGGPSTNSCCRSGWHGARVGSNPLTPQARGSSLFSPVIPSLCQAWRHGCGFLLAVAGPGCFRAGGCRSWVGARL